MEWINWVGCPMLTMVEAVVIFTIGFTIGGVIMFEGIRHVKNRKP